MAWCMVGRAGLGSALWCWVGVMSRDKSTILLVSEIQKWREVVEGM